MRTVATTRIYIIIGLFACIACLFVYRLYMLQIRDHTVWLEKAESQYVVTESGVFKRGTIYVSPRTGNPLPIATTESGYILAVDYRELENPATAFETLAGVLPTLDREQFFKYTQGPLGWRELDKRVSDADADKIRAFGIKGVFVVKTQWRVYPYADVMARTIGFVGASDTDSTLRGKYGLELAYDDNLLRASNRKTVNFFAELFGDFTSGTTTVNAEEADVVTTLEPVVSHMLKNELDTVQKTYNSEITGGIIMNPKTGEIYAMDAVPSYDVNDRRGVPQDYFVNPNTRSLFEFGSIMKPLTVAMGIDAGVIGRGTTYNDTGCTTLNTLKICNWDGRARGVTTIQTALNESLNMGMVFVQQLLGKDRFRRYVENLQLGTTTGIDAGGDAPGIINNLRQNRDIEFATASYGQGIAMTPLAMARALAALANNGVVPSPRLGKTLRFADGSEESIVHPSSADQVFSPATTETVSHMLTEVVDTALRHGTVKLEHMSVAAKTGTAFLAGANGGYDHDRYFHSMFGYFPSYDPQFLILLYTKDPKNVQYASETLTDALMSLTKDLVSYYEIPPDR